ncbi:MAG: hypothetical protein ACP5UN_03870 [Candidatus Micrarchaeia archaeon]
MERHEKLVANIFKKNNILYQQAITSSKFIKGKWISNRNDIFSVFDFMILLHNCVIFIQVTDDHHVSIKKDKIQTEFINKLEKKIDKQFNVYIITYKKKKNRIIWKIIKYVNDDLWVDVILYKNTWYTLDNIISYLGERKCHMY